MTAQMETTTVEPDRQEVISQPPGSPPASETVRRIGEVVLRWTLAILGALVIFGAFMAIKGVDPLTAYRQMWHSTFTDSGSWGGIAVRAAPIALTALAVAVPARAGLINVGGEGQLVLGGVAAAGVYLAAGNHLPGSVTLVLMLLAAAVAGAAWAALAALMRLAFGINEAVTTLLCNYVALDIMLYLIYSSWKDPHGSGQPATRALPVAARLPVLGHTRVHVGVLVAAGVAILVSLALSRTAWGFRLRVVGGNPEAARRAGLRVGLLLVTAMAVGGALAGLGGAVHLAGAEFKLRQGFGMTYGYVGFLASWLARHKPVRVALAAGVLSAIAVAGDSLQIDAGLPAASVNILMALVLLAAFGWGQTSRSRPARGGAR